MIWVHRDGRTFTATEIRKMDVLSVGSWVNRYGKYWRSTITDLETGDVYYPLGPAPHDPWKRRPPCTAELTLTPSGDDPPPVRIPRVADVDGKKKGSLAWKDDGRLVVASGPLPEDPWEPVNPASARTGEPWWYYAVGCALVVALTVAVICLVS